MNDRPGTWDKVKGKTNEIVGDITGDDKQQIKGEVQQKKGEFKQKVGKIFDRHDDD